MSIGIHDKCHLDREKSILALFSDGTLTLDQVISRIGLDPSLNEIRKRDLISSIKRVAAALQIPLEEAVADPDWLRRRLKPIAPAKLGLTKKSWSNIVSNVKAALVQAGAIPNVVRGRHLDGPWQELWEQLENSNHKISLTRFMTFCSRQGVHPAAVSDETVSEFARALRLASLRKNPDLALYYLTTSWNKAARHISGWPPQLLTVPKRRVVFRINDEALPTSFQNDLDRYLSVMACADPLADNAPPETVVALSTRAIPASNSEIFRRTDRMQTQIASTAMLRWNFRRPSYGISA